MKKEHKMGLLFIFIILVNFGCKKDIDLPEQIVIEKFKRTVLVCMEANNNLRSEALHSINRMEQGAADVNGAFLVYVKTNDIKSYLLEIRYDADYGQIHSDTVSTFYNEDFSDPLFLSSLIKQVQRNYPSDSYGLVLWSHATSWAPPIKLKAFGNDGGNEMDVIDLKNALPNNFDYIIFDACSMASLEVMFEFKNKAKYVIGSPSETIAESFPYHRISSLLFEDLDKLNILAEEYFNYYNSYPDDRRSATIALIKTAELDQLAMEMKSLIVSKKKYGDKFLTNGIQRMDFSKNFPVATYDFLDFLEKNFNQNELLRLKTQLNKTILYKASTTHFLSIPINAFSGLTCYIPYEGDKNLNYYKNFQWYRSSGIYVPFENY